MASASWERGNLSLRQSPVVNLHVVNRSIEKARQRPGQIQTSNGEPQRTATIQRRAIRQRVVQRSVDVNFVGRAVERPGNVIPSARAQAGVGDNEMDGAVVASKRWIQIGCPAHVGKVRESSAVEFS